MVRRHGPGEYLYDLAIAARGLGYLSSADRDGTLRRLPLLVRYHGAFYPSLAFRVICDYLQVPPANILVTPGRQILLRGAQRPGTGSPHDIVIPIDRHGHMIINYIGWERFKHYSLERIMSAAKNVLSATSCRRLAGKIVVLADVSTGTSDVGAVPLDANFPLGGLHSNVALIPSGNFLRELSEPEMLCRAVLLSAILVLALRYSSLTFALGTLGLAVGYVSIGVLGFLYGHVIANFVRPLLMLMFATVATVMQRYMQKKKLASKACASGILFATHSVAVSARM